MMDERRDGSSSGVYLRHFPSTPHLDTFSKGGGGTRSPENSHRSFNHSSALSGASSNVNLMANSYMPKTNFSTFMQHKKPIPPPKVYGLGGSGGGGNNNTAGKVTDKSRYQDDPNPYKVSTIDEYRIKVNDPFLPNKSCASHRNSQMFSFYTTAEGNGGEPEDDGVGDDDGDDEEDEDVREAFGQMGIRSAGGRSLYEEAMSSYSGASKVHRSATLKSSRSVGCGVTNGDSSSRRSHHRSGSASVSASSTGTGEIDIDGEYIIPEPDYEGFRHHRTSSVGGEECEAAAEGGSGRTSGSGIIIPGPISDSSCTGSEGYSSVSQGTSSSCSASDPDPYAVPITGRTSSSPDEGSILEANDSGIETPTRISEKDHMKIEYALMGRKTSIFVADCLANLYCMRKSNLVSRPNSSLSNQNITSSYSGQSSASASSGDGEWVLKYTGVPVLLLDLGETKSRDKRRIQIVLAELGSGLALWKDVIDNLSSYKVMEGSHTFHTMHLSTDHTKIIGLSFDDEECAELFYQRVDKLTSDFANISLSGSKNKSKLKKDKSNPNKSSIKSKFIRPKKSEISQPCCFNHISSLTSIDKKRFPSLQNFVSGRGNIETGSSAGLKSADQASVASSSSHEDFVSMSPLALADSQGSDMHF